MIGADEFTILDKYWNVAFCGSESGCLDFIANCRRAGLTVKGDVVHATKREIEAAFAPVRIPA